MDTTKILRFHFNNLWHNPESRFEESINHIEKNYTDKEGFFIANKFTTSLITVLTGKNAQAIAVKLLSSTDAMEELNISVNLSFMYLYKSSFDSLRRALEITILGQYFEHVQNNFDEVFDWIYSKKDTPRFNTMIDKLSKHQMFAELGSRFDWKNKILNHYWRLCDYSHTKGHEKSITTLNKKLILKPTINTEVFNDFLSLYFVTVQQIAIIYAIQNPILIIGLPILEKFGFSSHGYFSEDQAGNLRNLLPANYKEYIIQLIEIDHDIQNKIREFNDLPDSETYLKIKELLDNLKNNAL